MNLCMASGSNLVSLGQHGFCPEFPRDHREGAWKTRAGYPAPVFNSLEVALPRAGPEGDVERRDWFYCPWGFALRGTVLLYFLRLHVPFQKQV